MSKKTLSVMTVVEQSGSIIQHFATGEEIYTMPDREGGIMLSIFSPNPSALYHLTQFCIREYNAQFTNPVMAANQKWAAIGHIKEADNAPLGNC